ncbi:RHS repeat-associated core domain-containing protein, partial [Sulfuricurvum sp.]|uniref:RHS repeat-associated core domain-containing protein n=1 Tax=Sulfuricurvum sp. TaxID=2025608 RepID=UPI00262989E1
GVKSGTVGAQSDPIEASPSVFVNGKAVVRVGDVQYMQNKNTVGKVTTSESGSAAHITDEGKIEGNTQPEPIAMPYAKNKPTNNPNTSGSLGSRTGSPVLLKSGKLLYRITDAEFIAPIGFALQRVYVGDSRKGMFCNGWQCVYETQLIQSDPSILTLRFSDDQTFRFTYSEKGFLDDDDLGATLTLLSPQNFLLEYFIDAHTERYVNGHLTEIKDRNGNTLSLVRDSNGKLLHIASSFATLDFEYNREGNVSRVRDHTSRIWTYTYDTQGVQEPLQGKYHNLTHVTDPMGGIVHYVYQKSAPYLLEQIVDASGISILEVTYDTTDRVESYSEKGERFSYRYETNRVIKTDSMGNKTFYGLDNWGTICAITYPDGSTAREEYHDDTSILTDQGGNAHIKAFDKRHRPIREITPDKHTTLYLYEGDNPFASSIIRNDKTTTYTYDGYNNRTSITTPDKLQERFEYDDRGNVVSHTNREGITTQYTYNANNQRIRISDAMGGITQYVYDELGNCITIIDPQEQITQFEYDKLNRRIAIIETDKNTTRFYYDNAGCPSAIRDPQGNMTRYAYDSDGFLSRMINPADQLRTFTHARGKLIAITREDGVVYRFEYDKRGRKTSQSIGDKTTLYTYDSLGNLLSVKDSSGIIEYVYDSNAQIRLERQGDKSVSHAYNLDGSKRFIGYEGMHFNLMRNESGVLERIVQANQSYNLSFNTRGAQTALSYPNRIETKSVFDPLGRLTKRTLGETPLLQYTYDKSSRIISRNTTPITYDAGCRVTSVGEESYTYDESGNLLKENSVIDSLSGALLHQGDTKFTYDALGQLTEKNSPTTRTTYDYNIEGYLIGYERTSLTDSSFRAPTRNPSPVRGELVEPWTHPSTSSGRTKLHFTYDPLGRRVAKYYKSQSEEYHHRYLYAGDNIVAIYDNDTDELLATLLHEEDAIDSPLSIHVHPQEPLTHEEQWHYDTLDETERFLFNQSRIKRYYYHRDHQNSIVALSDDNAQIVEYYEYDIYGKITKSEKIAKTLNPYRYTGREIDTDDLYYYRARYYDPTIGRFITPDPIGFLSGDTNFYRYVGNDPINFIDHSGFSGISPNGTQNFSSNTLRDTLNPHLKSSILQNPKPSKGGGASAKMNCGVKVAGAEQKKEKPIKYLRFIFHTMEEEPTNAAEAYNRYLTKKLDQYKTLHEVYVIKKESLSKIAIDIDAKIKAESGAYRIVVKEIALFSDLSHAQSKNRALIAMDSTKSGVLPKRFMVPEPYAGQRIRALENIDRAKRQANLKHSSTYDNAFRNKEDGATISDGLGKASNASETLSMFGTDAHKVATSGAGKLFGHAGDAVNIVSSASWYEVGRNGTGVIFGVVGGIAGGIVGAASPIPGGAVGGGLIIGKLSGDVGMDSYDYAMKNWFGVEDEAYGME